MHAECHTVEKDLIRRIVFTRLVRYNKELNQQSKRFRRKSAPNHRLHTHAVRKFITHTIITSTPMYMTSVYIYILHYLSF